MNRLAWHFLNADWTTSSGNLLVKVGEPLVHVGDLVPRSSGLHASTRAIDALSYARGPVATLVECDGEFANDNADKFACRKRTALWGYDCMDELWTFARLAALEVLHIWPDAPVVVREFLETGNEDLQAAAWTAARDAAWPAAWAAAREARRAAWTAAWEAAWEAAWAAARDAAWTAAWDARDAAWTAAWDAALSKSNEILESVLFDGAISRGLVSP